MSAMTRVAAWQCQPGPLDVAGNLRRLDEACAAAAAQQAQVLVTPEMFTSGYAIARGRGRAPRRRPGRADRGRRRPDRAAAPPRDRLRAPGARARRDGAYNAATMVGPDGVVRGRHRKVHLFGDVDRGQFVANGERPAAFDFDGARVGMLICYDVEFPEAVRRLAVDGARTVLVPTANMTGCEEVQEILVPARACENNCGVVYANYCGADDVFEYNGLSMICGPRGEVLAQAGVKTRNWSSRTCPASRREPTSPTAGRTCTAAECQPPSS